MKTILIVGLTQLLLASLASAQGSAFLKVINLIDTGAPTFFTLDGTTFKRGNPVPTGFTSGAFELDPGSHSVSMKNEGAERPEMNIPLEMKPGASYGLLCFSSKEVKKDPDGKEIEVFNMKYTVLEGQDDIKKPKLTLFSLSKKELLEVRVKGRPYRLTPKTPMVVEVKVGEMVGITEMNDNEVGEIEIISSFHYVAFIDEDAKDGKLRLTFYEQRSYSGDPLVIEESKEAEKSEKPSDEKSTTPESLIDSPAR